MKSKISYIGLKYFILFIIILALLYLLLADGKQRSQIDILLIGGSIVLVILLYHGIVNMCESFIYSSKKEQFNGKKNANANILEINSDNYKEEIKNVSKRLDNFHSSDQKRIMSATSEDIFYQNGSDKENIIATRKTSNANNSDSYNNESNNKNSDNKKQSDTNKKTIKTSSSRNKKVLKTSSPENKKSSRSQSASSKSYDDRQPLARPPKEIVTINKSENCNRESGQRITNEMEYSKYHNVPVVKSQIFEYGYSFLDPSQWYPQPPYPPVCVTNNRCTVCPYTPPGSPYDLKEWNQSLRVTQPDDINVNFVKEKMNSGK